jgi:hypothetical protein
MSEREPSSSVVIRGMDATTFEQMEAFVDDLQQRPLERLLKDLPRLARLSSTKFALVSYVIKRKFDSAPTQEREAMRASIQTSAAAEPDEGTRERLGKLMERIR